MRERRPTDSAGHHHARSSPTARLHVIGQPVRQDLRRQAVAVLQPEALVPRERQLDGLDGDGQAGGRRAPRAARRAPAATAATTPPTRRRSGTVPRRRSTTSTSRKTPASAVPAAVGATAAPVVAGGLVFVHRAGAACARPEYDTRRGCDNADAQAPPASRQDRRMVTPPLVVCRSMRAPPPFSVPSTGAASARRRLRSRDR